MVVTQQTAGSSGAGATISVSLTTAPSASATGTLTINSASGSTTTRVHQRDPGQRRQPAVRDRRRCELRQQRHGQDGPPRQRPHRGRQRRLELEQPSDNSVRDAIMAASTRARVGGYSAARTARPATCDPARAAVGRRPGPTAMSYPSPATSSAASPRSTCGGGASSPTATITTAPMNGGADAFSGTRTVRRGVGAVRAYRHRARQQFLPQGRDAHRLPRRHLHLRRGDDQLRQLVHLLPHAHADDEDRGRPRLRPIDDTLPRRLHHHQPELGSSTGERAPAST